MQTTGAAMSYRHFVHHHVAHIAVDEELRGEFRRLIERVDRQVERWAHDHPTALPTAERSPLILEDVDGGEETQDETPSLTHPSHD